MVPCVVPLVRTVGGPDLIEEAGPPLLPKIQGADRAHPDQETQMPLCVIISGVMYWADRVMPQ